MGSTGSGRFTDYSGTGNDGTTGQGSGGGASGIDKCQQAFSVILEEIAQCDYYVQSKTVPATGFALSIILDGRVFAVDSNGTKVGALPTQFNYLAACLKSGVTYLGAVKASSTAPIPTVEADFVPQQT
ncbi:hypothetical protein NB640_06335 [Oxalobacter vibrioformis]|uniref:Uncharacterized protein n=1 Tax=Oxalobacter vibrioformis TaxID=933080 RepID=A0A9E9M2G6_9BURK|nr:hypothetical protein [Oxalobacter vibrioformis]WAW11243.1 hypothetical protein NB640_06335 [Oxalobacter vibrioformis]